MRHPLSWLLMAIRREDGEAILGDLEQEYRSCQKSSLGRFGAQLWYAWELLAAVVHGIRDEFDSCTTGLLGLGLEGGHMRSLIRLFTSHRGYAAMSILVLAVSVGVNLVVFTVVNALWIRPLPFPEPERVVTILRQLGVPTNLNIPGLRIFEGGIAGQVETTDMLAGLHPRIEIAGQVPEALGVTDGYFRVLGLTIRGRDFTAEDAQDGGESVAIISDRFWSRSLGSRPDVIGAVLPTKPFPIRIIGVAPPGFDGARRGERADLWVPTSLVRRLAPADWKGNPLPLMVFGRLGPSQTVPMVERRYREMLMDPDGKSPLSRLPSESLPTVTPLTEVYGTPETQTLMIREGNSFLVVSGLAMLVLLAGCATLAALVLVHYERRRSELSLKTALGAERWRLVFELMRELTWIGVAGSVGGILVAILGTRVVPSLGLPGGVDIARLDLSIDWRVCAVAIVATVLTLLVAAVRPIVSSTRVRLAGEVLSGPSTTSVASHRARQTLLALQVCATIVVLVAAGLFVRAVNYGFGSAPGFDVNRTVFLSVQEQLGWTSRYPDIGAIRAHAAERTARLTSALCELPGVREVAEGVSPVSPELSRGWRNPRTVKAQDRECQLLVGELIGSPNFLSALGVPILAGRPLSAADVTPVPHPAVITRSLAERLWPDGGALGQTLRFGPSRSGPFVVVGIAGDLAVGSLTQPGSGVIVTAGPGMNLMVSEFVIRTDRPGMIVGMIRRTIKGEVVRVATGREVVARDIGRQRVGAWFFSGFGLAALLLGVGGAFGLVAYLAESRRREFGIRLALGADMAHLVRRALAAALVPVAAGVAAGLILAGIVSQLFEAFLVGISALDALTYILVAVSMLSCAAVAALAAAWRLRRTNPSEALRAT